MSELKQPKPITNPSPDSKKNQDTFLFEARTLLQNEPIDLRVVHDRLLSFRNPAECQAFAEALNRVIEEFWKKGKYAFRIKNKSAIVETDVGMVHTTLYEGMPSKVYSGSFTAPLEDGIVRLRILFRLGWEEDLLVHQHEGGRMVNIHRGVGKFVARGDNGETIEHLMEPDTLICMPPYTAHNFRALTVAEAIPHIEIQLRQKGIVTDDATHLVRAVGGLLGHITWETDWRTDTDASLRKRINTIAREVCDAFDVLPEIMALAKKDPQTHDFLRALINDLVSLELDSIHVRYVDVFAREKEYKALFHERDARGEKNVLWRDQSVDRDVHHEAVKDL